MSKGNIKDLTGQRFGRWFKKPQNNDDYLYDIDGVLICEECLEQNFRKRIEDYVE